MKAYVLYENAEWLPPLQSALEKEGVPYECLYVEEGSFDLNLCPPQGVFLNRMSASADTRDHHVSIPYMQSLLFWLESYGRTVINGSQAFRLEVSKVAQYAALQALGILVPKTRVIAGGESTLRAAIESFGFPFVYKFNRGGKGIGVHLIKSQEEAHAFLASRIFQASPDGIHLLQEYIKPKDASITRVEIVGRQFLYAIRADTSRGFELCPAEACDVPIASASTGAVCSLPSQQLFSLRQNFFDPLIEQYLAFVRANSVEVAGIEFVEDTQGRKFTYDVNCNTNYSPAVEEAHGLSGMGAVARLVKDKLKEAQTSIEKRNEP